MDLHTPSRASQLRPMSHEMGGMHKQKGTLKFGQENLHNEIPVSQRCDWENDIKNKLGKARRVYGF